MNLSYMEKKMVIAAIKQGCNAANSTRKEDAVQKGIEAEGGDYNYSKKHAYYEGVRIASEVLFEIFAVCSSFMLF